jgi:hypothetical protein
MITIHKSHTIADPFCRFPKAISDDENLSWQAKGILCYLLGKPDGWKTRVADIVNRGKDGADAVRSALKELRKAGYVRLTRLTEKGKVTEWKWEVSDAPCFAKPDADFPDVENHHHSKNESSKKELSKESKESAIASPQRAVASQETHAPTWKPDGRTKKEKLASIKPPKDFPSEDRFDAFLAYMHLDNIAINRPDLYSDLCDAKWHRWTGRTWQSIADWERFVVGLLNRSAGARCNRGGEGKEREMSDVAKYLASIGSKGGKAGTGKSKARTRKQAQAAALIRWPKGKKRITTKTN